MNRGLLLILILLLSLVSCASRSAKLKEQLNAAVGVASKADLILEYGVPSQIVVLPEGEFWIYHGSEVNTLTAIGSALQGTAAGMRGYGPVQPPQSYTTELILLFDAGGKLNAWKYREY